MDNSLISINVDWLQLHCRHKKKVSRWNLDVYEVKRRDSGTKIFEEIEYIFRKGRLIATACSTPRSSVLPSETCIIKFENDVLYDVNLDFLVQEFILFNDLLFVGISRLDVASDFNSFVNKLHPELLIHKFLGGKFVKMGKGKYKVHGEVGRKITHDYLRFGGKDSPVSVYLYNKTKELQQVKMKPHIVEQWDAVKLDLTKDVWRLEVSVKGTKKILVNHRDGESIDFYSLDMLKQKNLRLLWCSMVEKYFKFAYDKRSESNKSRLKPVQLFDQSRLVFHGCVIDRTDKKESTHMDAFLVNKLFSVFEELRGTNDDLAKMSLDVRKYFQSSRDLKRRKQLATDKIKANQSPENISVPDSDSHKFQNVTPDEWSEFDFME